MPLLRALKPQAEIAEEAGLDMPSPSAIPHVDCCSSVPLASHRGGFQSDPSALSDKGYSFQDLLALLAAEYKRVSFHQLRAEAECAQLRAQALSRSEASKRSPSPDASCESSAFHPPKDPSPTPVPRDCIRRMDLKVHSAVVEKADPGQRRLSQARSNWHCQNLPLAEKLQQEKPAAAAETDLINAFQRQGSTNASLDSKETWTSSTADGKSNTGIGPPRKSSRASEGGKSLKSGSYFDLTLVRGLDMAFRRSTPRHKPRMTLNDALRSANFKIARTTRLVVNPERSKCLLHWDQVTIAALIFVAVVTPVQVCMMGNSRPGLELDALFFINVLVDLIFFCDMILQFFLMYPVTTNYGVVLENRHSMIIKNYLCGWFIIDLASILPFDLMQLEQVKAVKVIRLLRLLKLARMCKVSRLFRRLEMRMAIRYQRLALAKFLTMLFLVTHWMANLWALTLVLVEPEDGIPRWVDVFDDLEVQVVEKTRDTYWKLYLTCIYFTSYTITSVGYGDIGPANITERIVCTLMIFVSGITWALLIAQVCSIVSSMDAEEQNFRKVMDELNHMMEDRKLPGSMRRRLRSFFLSNKSAARHARDSRIVEFMSPALRGEVCLELNRVWIEKVSFLKPFLLEAEKEHPANHENTMQDFVVDVSRSLSAQVYAQGEAFGQPQVLYILNRGLASHTGRVRRWGSVWGTDFVLSNAALLEPYGSFALTYVEVTYLGREQFMTQVERHSARCPDITKIVRRYCGWLALQRHIRMEVARQRWQPTKSIKSNM